MNRVKKQRKGRKADRAPALEPDRPDAGRFSGYMAGIFDISSLVLGTISAVSPYLVWWAISPGNNRGPGAAISQKHRRVLAPYLRTFSRRRWGRDWPADDRLVETLYPLGDQLLLATEGQAGEAALMTLWEWGLNSFAEEDAHLQAEAYLTIERLYDRVVRQGLSPDGAAGERFAALRELYDGFIAVTIGEHFVVAERRFLEGAMKALVVLRALGLGYVGAAALTRAVNKGRTRAARMTPEQGVRLLERLWKVCRGCVLYCREGEGGRAYMVERSAEDFAAWVVAGEMESLACPDLLRAASDAFWSSLTFRFICHSGREVSIPAGESYPHPLWVRHLEVPGHEALAVTVSRADGEDLQGMAGKDKRGFVLVLDVPFRHLLGRSICLKWLAGNANPEQVYIWMPDCLSPDEEERVRRCISLARALREPRKRGATQVYNLLLRDYLALVARTLQAILDCYRRGTIVGPGGRLPIPATAASMGEVLRQITAWAIDRDF